MTPLDDKMQQLRESVPQVGKEATRDAPSTYRINAINPAQDIDDQWALIDTPHNYGSRGPHQGVRKIRVGDELPQGSVVSIAAEGIQVLPNFEGSEEYVIPFGGSYEPPPGEKTPAYDDKLMPSMSAMERIFDMTAGMDEHIKQLMMAFNKDGTPDPAAVADSESYEMADEDPTPPYDYSALNDTAADDGLRYLDRSKYADREPYTKFADMEPMPYLEPPKLTRRERLTQFMRESMAPPDDEIEL